MLDAMELLFNEDMTEEVIPFHSVEDEWEEEEGTYKKRSIEEEIVIAHNVTTAKRAKMERSLGSLVQAARSGAMEQVQILVQDGVDINETVCGCTALMYAAFYGRDEMVQYLLQHSAQMDKANLSGVTALMWAVEREHKRTVELLLQAGAKAEAADKKGLTALHKAVKLQRLDIVQLLVEVGEAPLTGSAATHKADRELKVQQENFTVLQEAVFGGDVAIVQYLIECGADVNECNNQGRTALHRAVHKNQPAIVELLLECGAEVNATDMIKRSALHWASFFGHLNSVQTLVQNGADVRLKDQFAMTAESIAKMKKHRQILSVVVSQ